MARRVQSSVFIGRDAEVASALDAVRRAAAAREGATVLVTGEAGIGKSRFIQEVAKLAAHNGLVVLKGACDEFGPLARPFGILQQLAPGLLAALERRASALSPGEARETLEALVAGTAPAGESGQLSRLFASLLVQLCEDQLVMVIVDDLHWADESSRLLFREMASVATSHACLLVGAYRDNEVERGHPLRAVLADAGDDGGGGRATLEAYRSQRQSADDDDQGGSRGVARWRQPGSVRLGISTKTASVHVSNILRKLNASNRVEAAVRASQGGLF